MGLVALRTCTLPLKKTPKHGVLLSKDWFEWADKSKPLLAGTRLIIFHLRLEVTHKDEVSYCSVAVAGDVLVRDHLDSLVKVAYVDFEHDESQGGSRCGLSPTRDGGGSIKSLPLFADINVRTHPKRTSFRNSIRADRPCCFVTRSLRRHAIKRVGSSRVLPSLVTHWASSLPSLLLLIPCQISLLSISCFITV